MESVLWTIAVLYSLTVGCHGQQDWYLSNNAPLTDQRIKLEAGTEKRIQGMMLPDWSNPYSRSVSLRPRSGQRIKSEAGTEKRVAGMMFPHWSNRYLRRVSLRPRSGKDGASEFYVALSRTVSIGAGETLKFDNVITNNGDVYDVTSGVFTAPTSGTYIFQLSLTCEEGSFIELSIVQIGKDDDIVKPRFNTICDTRQNSGYHQNGGSAILKLSQGDKVMVRMMWPNYVKEKVTGKGLTTFSGYMLSS